MSTANAVDLLARYAEQMGADLILANSHGRSGISRLLLGSFSESLLMRSRVPVLTLGPESRAWPNFEKILFPTEFDIGARVAFREAVALAKAFRTSITLLHAVPHPIEPIFQSGMYLLGGSWIPVQSYFTDAVERQRRRADAWARWARGVGVHVDVRIETDDRPISDQIARIARELGAGLVFMEGRTGPVAAALIGSVTREVIRQAPCPVWVMRSRGARVALRRAA